MVGAGHQGWAPGNPDPNDQYYKPAPDTEMKDSVNLREEYPGCLPDAYNQFTTSSCVANASAAALWFEIQRDEPEKMGTDGPSRQFIYYNARTLIPDEHQALADSGTWNRIAMKAIDKKGACHEETWPFGDASDAHERTLEVPADECFDEGVDHTIEAYFRLDPDRTSDSEVSGIEEMSDADKDADGQVVLDNVRMCLSEGYPFVFAFRYYWEEPNWDKSEAIWSLDDPWAEGLAERHGDPPTDADGNSYGGHAVLGIGYDEDRQAVLIQNSWGVDQEGWETENGCFWMPYDWITDYAATNDFWTIRRSRPDHGHYTLGEMCSMMTVTEETTEETVTTTTTTTTTSSKRTTTGQTVAVYEGEEEEEDVEVEEEVEEGEEGEEEEEVEEVDEVEEVEEVEEDDGGEEEEVVEEDVEEEVVEEVQSGDEA